ncbi:glycosyltransferase family 2 protein [Psychroflexus salinarum]|uniref:Glycosyltransferase family 2 protein n=1 Tax=Psychroflexus salinarum TaxID=546024 RepID=A0ABW3GSI3_9FLAO
MFESMVSVIIPNYNHFEYLTQRIDSVISQTYNNIEIIILDDCSLDNSRDIIEQYKNHPKVSTVVYNKENSGSVFRQWTKGIKLAKGEYIWIAESDDFAEPELLSKMIPVLDQDKEIGLIYCNSNVIYDKNNANKRLYTLNDLRRYMFKTPTWDSSFIMDGKLFLQKYLSKKCVINNASAVVMRKDALDLANVNLEQFRYAGDWAAYNNISMNFKIAFINETLSNYRDHVSNTSKKAFINHKINYENYSIISKYYNYLLKNKSSTVKYIYSVRKSFLPLLIRSKDRKEIYKRYKSINSKMINKALIFLPQVMIETYISRLLNKYVRK